MPEIPDKNFRLILLFIFRTLIIMAQDGQGVHTKTDSIINISEITVSAYRISGSLRKTPGSLSVITGNDLKSFTSPNLSDAINSVPGVTMQTGTYVTGRIVIRGMGSRTPYNTNRIRAYLNDIPLTTSDGVSTPEEIDMAGVEKIEIVKGPSSALYGSGLGGSINMYTPQPTENMAIAAVSYGSFNTTEGRLSGTMKKGRTLLWGNLSHINSSGYRENNRYQRTTLLSTHRWEHTRWSANTTFLLTGVNGEIPSSLGKTMFENNPSAAAPNWNAIRGLEKYLKGMVAITLKNYLNGNVTNNMTVIGRLNNNFERRPFNNLADRTLSGGFRYTVNYKTAEIDFVTGVELIREQYIWKLDKDTVLLNKNMEVRDQFNIFSVFNYRPVPSLTLSFAGAVNLVSYKLKDLFSQNGDQSGSRTFPVIFSPRLGINYAPGRIFAFYASAGHGFSMPSPEETLLPQGNVNSEIRPEQGFQYETGIRVSKGKTLAVDAAIYLIELRDLLVTKRITEDIFTGINAGKTHHHGFELQFRTPFFDNGKFPGSMIFYLSYTYSSNRFVSFNDAGIIYDGKYLPGIPVHDLSLRFEWKTFNRFEILPSVHYTGNQFLNDENSLRYNGFLLINIKTIMNFSIFKDDDLSLFLTLNNITNSKYASMLIVNAIGFNDAEPRYYYPGLPLNASAGVRFNF